MARRVIATYDFHYGKGNDEEIIRKGDWFTPTATSQASADEEAKFMVSNFVARWPRDGELPT